MRKNPKSHSSTTLRRSRRAPKSMLAKWPLKTRLPLSALAALTMLTALTACDSAVSRSLRDEREDRLYQSAMTDYNAGRIDAAVKGFEAVVRANPANAEARFQLACLLHDAKKDFAGAYCAYREFLLRSPDGEKAALAKQRLDVCERELAMVLAERHRLTADKPTSEAIDALRSEAKAAKTRVAQLEKQLVAAKAQQTALINERKRLLAAARGEDESLQTTKNPEVREIKDLLDEKDESAEHIAIADDAAALRAEEKEETTGHDAIAGGAAALRAEEKSETAMAGSSLLPRRTAGDAARAEKPAAEKQAARPPTYEVQEGDTLYKIAVRFYGSMRAWKLIRDANKTLISTDGRVNAGDTIRLP